MIHSLNDYRMVSKKSYEMINTDYESKDNIVDNYLSVYSLFKK